MQHIYDFFGNAGSVHVVSSCTGSRESQSTKYISCIFEAKFFIRGAIKSAALLTHALCKTVRPILSDHCLSVTLVYCGQMVGWIKMPLGVEGLGPGHIVAHGDPAPPKWGHSSPPLFGSCL